MKIGEKIKYLRIEKDWTQGELSDKLEMAQTSVSAMERGTKAVTLETLDKLSEIFGVDKSYFIEDQQVKKEHEQLKQQESAINSLIDYLIETKKIEDVHSIDNETMKVLKTFIIEEVKERIRKKNS